MIDFYIKKNSRPLAFFEKSDMATLDLHPATSIVCWRWVPLSLLGGVCIPHPEPTLPLSYTLPASGDPHAPKNAYEWEFTSVLLLCEKDGKENNKIKQNKVAITWTALSGRNDVSCAHNFQGTFTHGNSWSLPPEEPGSAWLREWEWLPQSHRAAHCQCWIETLVCGLLRLPLGSLCTSIWTQPYVSLPPHLFGSSNNLAGVQGSCY